MARVPEIRIMRERCVRCGDCVELCPQSGPGAEEPVFVIERAGTDVRLAHIENCIACFTCVEFCRAAAIAIAQDLQHGEDRVELHRTRPANRII